MYIFISNLSAQLKAEEDNSSDSSTHAKKQKLDDEAKSSKKVEKKEKPKDRDSPNEEVVIGDSDGSDTEIDEKPVSLDTEPLDLMDFTCVHCGFVSAMLMFQYVNELLFEFCFTCREFGVSSGNQLVECQECHSLYHQECHSPPVSQKCTQLQAQALDTTTIHGQ